MKTRFAIVGALVVGACSSAPKPAPAPQPSAPAPTRGAPTPNVPAPTPDSTGGGAPAGGRGGFGAGGGGAAPAAPRPYNRVITADAKTRSGMFKVHRVGDRVYFEIPARELGKDELMVGRFARAAAGNQTPARGSPGFGEYAGDTFDRR